MYSSLKTSSILQGFPKYRSNLVGNSAFIPGGFESIATVTASGGESSLTFSSIPQGYASLQIRGIMRFGYSDTILFPGMQYNNSTTGYSRHAIWGTGTSAFTSGLTSANSIGLGSATGSLSTANAFGAFVIDIHNYASTTQNKTARVFSGSDHNSGSSTSRVNLTSGTLYSTTAITSLSFYDWQGIGATFAAGTKLALYGIKGA